MATTDTTSPSRRVAPRALSGDRALRGVMTARSSPAAGSQGLNGYAEGRNGFSLGLLLAIALMVPTQFSISPGGVLLTPLRLSLILLVVPGMIMFLSRRPLRLHSFDIFYIAFSLWTAVAIIHNRGIGAGVERAGQFVLETAIIYIVLQGSVRTLAQLRAIYMFFFWTCVVLLVLAIPEILAKEHVLQNAFNSMTGRPEIVGSLAGERLGVMRVTSIFAHPILYGVFNASLFAMLWFLARSPAQRLFYVTIVSAGTLATLSSGPILVIVIQIGLIIVEQYTRWMKRRAYVIGGVIAAFLVFVQFASNRGLFVLVALFTLSPASAYNRRLIWEHGVDDVMRSPVFGILPELWTRPFWMKPSIDNYWLFQAMQGGVPSVIFLALSILLIIRRCYRSPVAEIPPVLEGVRRGWFFLIIAMMLCGATVHFFDKLQPYFAFMVATGAVTARLIIDWERTQGGDGGAAPSRAAPPPAAEGDRPTAAGKPRTWL